MATFILLWLISFTHDGYSQKLFMDIHQPIDKRVNDLLKQLTVDEKISLLQFEQPAIPRLNMVKYNWWNECLHGVARNGIATVFPQAIGAAATWNPGLIKQEADAISTEARAKHNAVNSDGYAIYEGLTFWSPNINIFRDPRWGRGQETYGEDPFLTSRIGVAFVEGLQGSDPRYLKVAATAKHYAVHSGPEATRHAFDANTSDRDLYETYLPAFEALVKEARVEGVMGAYNRFRGDACCASHLLLQDILRNKWGFQGHVVSDCWALRDMFTTHRLFNSEAKAAAMSLIAGVDITCGPEFWSLKAALDSGWVSQANIDTAVKRILKTRFRLGMFDPSSAVPYTRIPITENDSPRHDSLAWEVARQSIVLLKNKNKTLPLSKAIRTIAVFGALANDTGVLLGNYYGKPSHPVTILQGIRNKVPHQVKVTYAMGANKPWRKYAHEQEMNDSIINAVKLTDQADALIVVAGISAVLEGENGDVAKGVDGFDGGDRTHLDLPEDQQLLIKALQSTGKPLIVVLTNGSALSVKWETENVAAILEAWYPGQQGGNAVADVLFGDYNPAGRLPVTFYASVKDLPPFDDYAMKGRTYRYFEGKPLYPFGYGLSYSSFAYFGVKLDTAIVGQHDSLTVSFSLKNISDVEGDEVVQMYIRNMATKLQQPIKSLQGFRRVHLQPGETISVSLPLKAGQLRYFDEATQNYVIAAGNYEIQVGASSEDIRIWKMIEVK